MRNDRRKRIGTSVVFGPIDRKRKTARSRAGSGLACGLQLRLDFASKYVNDSLENYPSLSFPHTRPLAGCQLSITDLIPPTTGPSFLWIK